MEIIGTGSSPLARGLHQRLRVGVDDVGIIPARAGFTRRTGRGRRMRPDHPRSRGVYAATSLMNLSTVGSSPLARGLPHPPMPIASRARIIPARAGFTRRN